MKKIRLVMMTLACVFLTGCMKIRLKLDVSPKGDIDEIMEMLLDTELLTLDGGDLDEALESMKQDFMEGSEIPEEDITIVKEEDEEGKVTFAGISTIKRDIDEFERTVVNRTVTVTIPVDKVMSDTGSVIGEDSMSAEDLAEMREYGFEYTLDVNMPDVPTANVGTVTGNTVRIDLLDLPADVETIVISSKTGEKSPFLIGAVIAGILLGLFLFFSSQKKNKAAAAESETSEDPVNAPSAVFEDPSFPKEEPETADDLPAVKEETLNAGTPSEEDFLEDQSKPEQ